VGPISEHTNARPHCSFQLGTTTQYGTTWLSVASSTDETGTVVQTLDYYPYGGTRISNSTSTNEKRKFIGQFSDDSGLSYLNARYYESTRGQFISQDPSFLSVGDPNQVKQVTGRDQQTFLADPQLANSYNYGRDNPITNKDPNGNSPLILGGAIAGSFYGVGERLAYDLEYGQPSSVTSYIQAGVTGAAKGATAGASLAYLGPAGTLRAYGYYETGNNIYNFGEMVLRNPSKYTTQQRLGAANSLYIDLASRIVTEALPKEYRVIYESLRAIYDSVEKIAQTTQSTSRQPTRSTQGTSQSSGTSGSASSLPATVTQNGITYVRNSSGLLNFAPTTK
jgi:RHS repeat-associated protein